jgi:hypothetical protein
MNLVDVSVVEVIVKIHKIDNRIYSKTIITDCFGRQEEKVITGDYNYVRKYKVGYTWLE